MSIVTYERQLRTKPICGGIKYPRQKYYDQYNIFSTAVSASFYGDLDVQITTPRSEFQRLALQWKTDTELQSNVTLKAMHPAYQQIIGMGERAIPFILREFQVGKYEDWFFALSAIASDKAPSTAEVAGNIRAMAEVWLTWGKNKGYL